LAFKLPLPGKYPGHQDRNSCERGEEEIAVSRGSQQTLLAPLGEKIKRYASDEQRDREVNQYHVLHMLCENYRFQVKGMQGCFSLTAR
jgi:hypothetical protein